MNSLAQEWLAAIPVLRSGVPGRLAVALRAAVSLALPLTIGLALARPGLGAIASFGALAALPVQQTPYRYRARAAALLGIGLSLAVLIGELAASPTWMAMLAAGTAAGLASIVCQAAQLPPPRELMLVMTMLIATNIAGPPRQAVQHAGLALGGAALAWLVAMSPAVLGRYRHPEQRAVAAALTGVAGLLDAIATPHAAEARHAAVNAVRQARATVGQAALRPEHPLARLTVAGEALLEAVLHVEIEATAPVEPSWANAVRALIPQVWGGLVTAAPPTPERMAGADQLARVIEAAAAPPAGSAATGTTPLPWWPGLARQLRAAISGRSVVVPSAARIAIGVAVGIAVGRTLGVGSAYWIGLTAAAMLQGSNLALVRRRVVHRVIGTVVGVGLAFVVLAWHPPAWAVVLAAVLFQALVELIIPFLYGLAVIAITVLALLLFHLTAPGEAIGAALGARLLDTGIGVVLALLLRRILWPRATSVRVPQAQTRTLAEIRRVFDEAWDPATDPRRLSGHRHRLQAELATLRAIHLDALADAMPTDTTDARWPITAEVEQLAFLALSMPGFRAPPDAGSARRYLEYLDRLTAAAAGGPVPAGEPPALATHPRTSAATASLAGAIRDSAAARADGRQA